MDAHFLGIRIRQYRQKNNMSLIELASKTGISKSRLNQIENGEGFPSMDAFMSLLHALNIRSDYLLQDYAEVSCRNVVMEQVGQKKLSQKQSNYLLRQIALICDGHEERIFGDKNE